MDSTIAISTPATSSATPTGTDIITQGMGGSINNSKPSSIYLYPSVAVLIFLVAGIHICRYFDSRRLARRRVAERRAIENAALDRWRRAAGLNMKGELHVPRMFTAVLGKPEDKGWNPARAAGWTDLLPLSANVKKSPRPGAPKPASPTSSSSLQNLKMGANQTLCAFRKSINFIIRRGRPPQPPPHALQPLPATSPPITAQPNHTEYVYRPQTLVTGIVIAMPDARRPFHRSPPTPHQPSEPHARPVFIEPHLNPSQPDEEDLPEVSLGYIETDWSRYGKPTDSEEEEEELAETKSSVISPSLEIILFDRVW
ncbi:hypothetical protein FRB90_000022 [Tulasnella sp. 427]|nr:hypothetical protein FRB90_000022 [Tulasnella sp. 427]